MGARGHGNQLELGRGAPRRTTSMRNLATTQRIFFDLPRSPILTIAHMAVQAPMRVRHVVLLTCALLLVVS